jgi:hypothetical protein
MLLSCQPHVPSGVFGCASDDACPTGLVCSLKQQRCVYDVSSDEESVTTGGTAGSTRAESGRAAVSGAGRGGASPGISSGQASGGATACAVAEICDDKDNDCDGKVDEGLVQDCDPTLGGCSRGTRTCRSGAWSPCQGGAPITAEVCDADSHDENCDGASNEGCSCVTGKTQSCVAGQGACAAGMQTCDAGKWSKCAGQQASSAEICDGVDNDCNGSIDDAPSCKLVWSAIDGSARPSVRRQAATAFDTDHNWLVLHGGLTGTKSLGETLAFDGSAWRQLETSSGPSARRDHAMVYDASRKCLVMFGGHDGAAALGDTWELDDQAPAWRKIEAQPAPSARSYHAMAYDVARQRVVLFGGWSNGQPQLDTWEYDGKSWQQPSLMSPPPARRSAMLAYDTSKQRLLMFGGTPQWSTGSAPETGLGDLWSYDGKSWQRIVTAFNPPARWFAGFVWYAARNSAVLFGGWTGTQGLRDTLMFDGQSWMPLSDSGMTEISYGAAVGYDAPGKRVLAFGGMNADNAELNALWQLK